LTLRRAQYGYERVARAEEEERRRSGAPPAGVGAEMEEEGEVEAEAEASAEEEEVGRPAAVSSHLLRIVNPGGLSQLEGELSHPEGELSRLQGKLSQSGGGRDGGAAVHSRARVDGGLLAGH
jgi:hypothetical protein